ncbi:MAG TPA: hypothetical protein VFN25_11745 [Dokdonella sp.]|uniref:hypothetical protein n=1 Tax=Dokdonella sp. TaxID=2291710 RepID=UPI002D80C998|nr:hypothetical protein [Dokdonella sp.]HET9033568.1 hypothetical protein [Dokdonella sp.]
MKSRTLTTIGLPVRLDVLIKSHLKLVNARTIDEWAFSEDANSDVAICDPESPLSVLTVKRSRQSGSPLCISLVDSCHHALEGTAALHNPLRVGELIELLDKVSKGMDLTPAVPEIVGSAPPSGDHSCRLARTLHELMLAGSRDLHLVEAGGLRFCLLPVSRSVFLAEPLDDSWLERMLNVGGEVTADVIPLVEQQQILSGFQHRASLIKLLWHAGLHSGALARNPVIAEGALLSLSRWPDFGALKYEPEHLRMSAELSRKHLTLEQLAHVTRSSIESARAFINACALCDLITIGSTAIPASIAAPVKNETFRGRGATLIAPRRSLGFLNSIRAALGLRAS